MGIFKKLFVILGRIAYWVAWPVSWVYLRGSRRTRLLLLCGDEILVVDNWLGARKWNLPGGGLHNGEDPLLGLLREVREETGIALDKADVRFLKAEPYTIHGFSYECHYFTARVDQKPPTGKLPLEINSIRWVRLAEINAATHGPDVLRAIRLLDSP